MRSYHYSYQTEKCYLYWIKDFIRSHKMEHPQSLSNQDVSDYLSYLAVTRHVSSNTQDQALNALVFYTNKCCTTLWANYHPFLALKN